MSTTAAPPRNDAGSAGRVGLAGRLVRLYAGLVLFGVSLALMVRANLGLGPWDVFHQGVADRTGLSIGIVVNLTAVVVLLLWIPLRQRPGLGTISNVVLVGFVTDATLVLLATPDNLALRAAMLVTGILANAVATALYVGAGLGPGPRDGLMTGLAARGHSIRLVRTSIEIAVLALGWLLGGSVGVGTVLYALTIGPLIGYLMPRLGAKS
jgi:uncharacterized membrane protein YczE